MTDYKKVMTIDGMAFVNKVGIKPSQVHICLDFAECLINIINNETKVYDEVRIIFDKYGPELLKVNTRATCTLGLSAVRYKISDNTKIGHLETKEFISSIETKNDLTEYLSEKLQKALNVDFFVVFGTTTLTNMASFNPDFQTYSQEEADTGIILHALDVCRSDPFSEVVVSLLRYRCPLVIC